MNATELLLIQLRSLAVFRGILQNNVIKKLAVLLQVNAADTCAAVDAYSAFAAALYTHTDNFSDYLLKAVLDDENVYVHARCGEAPVSKRLEDALLQELSFLQVLSQFDGAALRDALIGEQQQRAAAQVPVQVATQPSPKPQATAEPQTAAQPSLAATLPRWDTTPLDFTAAYRARIADLPRQGYGIFAKYHVFTVRDGRFMPVKHPDPQSMASLSGYERERSLVLANTRALLEGKPAANALLYGDAGTGKSSTVKAVANALYSEGLRLIEVKKNQLYQIPDLVDSLSHNPLKFILFIDDLSFSSNDDNFAALKAILEGSVGNRGTNLAVYATSNRRHLVKETFSGREGDEVHLADTMQELMSLSARFGLTVTFSRPDKELYCHIVQHLAVLYGIDLPAETLLQKAEAHALRAGGRSPRVAKQFIEQLKAEV